MKKFKNAVSVKLSGIKEIDEAFKKKAEEIGYRYDYEGKIKKYYLFNFDDKEALGKFGIFNHAIDKEFNNHRYILPQDWHKAIEAISEVEEEKFKVGGYARRIYDDYGNFKVGDIGRIIDITKGGSIFFQNDEQGHLHHPINLSPVSDKEVEEWLIKKAKEMFPDRSKYIAVREINKKECFGPDNRYCTDDIYQREEGICGKGWHYNSKTDTLYNWGYGAFIVYESGTWAIPKPSYHKIIVNGYEAEFKEEVVKLGCAEIDKDIFWAASEWLEGTEDKTLRGNKAIEGIKIGDVIFTTDQIKGIAEYYKK